MTKVALLRCDDYHTPTVKEKILEGFSNIGLDPSLFADKKVLLKPNLLNASTAEKAVVTHPEFFRAVLQWVKACGGTPVMGESPAFQPLSKVMKKTGYDRVVAEEGCEVADPKKTAVLFYGGPSRFRRFEVTSALFDSDIVVNLPKFKTHGLTYVTGAVKNFFGFIHGLTKSQWHLKAPTKEAFSSFLLDLYMALLRGFEPPKRYIHIMDAIVGMEGHGPGVAGTPKKIGAILMGDDAVAVDSVAASLVGLDKSKLYTLTLGEERELGAAGFEKIDVRGSAPEEFHIDDFVPSRGTLGSHVERWPMNTSFFKNLVIERPVPSRERCTLCYQCKAICPGGAIAHGGEDNGVPSYDYEKCFRCLCCMEICPEAAIRLKKGSLQWLLESWARWKRIG
ncbi:MAG: DUF362 domain-containing protein [Desulfobacteraceae bacterium]|jgi:uncharacterized protein (DUF362 family)/Pyruvate/2-oxoacid:ferredoxin oxidoreductase delta subunit